MMGQTAQFLLIAGVSGLLWYYGRPRGLRNNNPGNIRHGSSRWAGMADVQLDPDFVQFRNPQYGIRAMAVLLRNYQSQGYATIGAMIARWAPVADGNDTGAYADYVASRVGVPVDEPVNIDVIIVPMLAAMIRYENGVNPYSTATIVYAVNMQVTV